MDIKINRQNGCLILDIEAVNITDKEVESLEKFMENFKNSKKRVGLNLKKIKKIDSLKFINFIKKQNLSLFGIDTFIMTYLYLAGASSLQGLFLNARDFIANKRPLIKRRFRVL